MGFIFIVMIVSGIICLVAWMEQRQPKPIELEPEPEPGPDEDYTRQLEDWHLRWEDRHPDLLSWKSFPEEIEKQKREDEEE